MSDLLETVTPCMFCSADTAPGEDLCGDCIAAEERAAS
jgi:hypothetical protein